MSGGKVSFSTFSTACVFFSCSFSPQDHAQGQVEVEDQAQVQVQVEDQAQVQVEVEDQAQVEDQVQLLLLTFAAFVDRC